MEIKICNEKAIKEIVDGINSYNLQKVPFLAPNWTPIEYFAENENGKVIGGILGGIGCWNGFEIKVLWVNEKYRNQGIGSKILNQAEKIAKEKGATIAMLDTFDFQAKEFYLKQQYKIIGEIENFPEGHQRIYFSKRLDS
ncbi:GNAT family N-acetyltransferase [Aureivirga marina]|uniref:GNAT family N-acetyltransferase n=1 Tax=Aureivirga marina TaxID=1182451 RepID=UPI0018CBBD78|nr:GNAT family N-acetyltransferase [Aureivirga marina]